MTSREAVFTFPDSGERLFGELRLEDEGAPHVLLQGEGTLLEKAQKTLNDGGVLHGEAALGEDDFETFTDRLTGPLHCLWG